MASSQDQGEHGTERAQGRWSSSGSRTPPDPQLPTQAAQCLAEQSFRTTTREGDYFGLQNEQTKAIYTYLQCPPPTSSSLQM